MGYRNYVSVYCEETKLFKNYDVHDHPYKNAPYALRFVDDIYDGKSITVKCHSCNDKIHFVFANMDLQTIQFKACFWRRKDYNEDTESGSVHDQLFTFVAKRGLFIVFYELHSYSRTSMLEKRVHGFLCYGRCVAVHLGRGEPYMLPDFVHGDWLFDWDETRVLEAEKSDEEKEMLSLRQFCSV